MIFHVPSFVLGCVAGAGLKSLAPRLRPVALEMATLGARLLDLMVTKAARGREDISDLWAEARARARAPREPEMHPSN